jgi:regulator of protease activity HflC (stomatin/prohibitin superfamily)
MANSYPNLTRAAGRFGLIAGIVLLLLLVAAGCMTKSIGAGEQGVKYSYFSGTNLDESYGEGFHVFMPWEQMIDYDVRVNNADEEIEVLSSNGLTIGMDMSVRYRPTVEELPQLHTTYGQEYYERLVQPELRSVARQVVGQFTPEELYSTRRAELQEQIESNMEQAVESRFIEIEAVLIRDIGLPDQIRRAIENKLEEEQRVEQARLSIQRAEQEAERKRVEARGDADRAQIIAQSMTPSFLQFQGIQATRELATSNNAKVVIVGGGEGGLPIILGGQ